MQNGAQQQHDGQRNAYCLASYAMDPLYAQLSLSEFSNTVPAKRSAVRELQHSGSITRSVAATYRYVLLPSLSLYRVPAELKLAMLSYCDIITVLTLYDTTFWHPFVLETLIKRYRTLFVTSARDLALLPNVFAEIQAMALPDRY